ncbi:DUF5698 domain-containing protein [Paenibacillus polymyxa]|uniref:DUF5698 domain-containing protein n=1 Tax=Paenibacillus polymyxa (strain SC2) TaxID=886882 RepID=E3EJN2_PAEPS|nr:DUF5698 domain-containing protein [Paenibacillus polymyxa]ADO59403.1 hypothetical protein PPSC2_28040 [Paenibacillus polymyxa SC2]WPQ59755.1 DUF5698 domain-containing protein [Paenibacillus polymyxa]
MSTILILELLGVIAVNALSNSIGTLKTIFISKKYLKPAYVITFLDAIIFATALKQIASGNGVEFLIAFAIGKVIGVYLADVVENRLALGILETEIFLNDKDRMIEVADTLRDKGYTVNTFVSYGYKGVKRYKVDVTILRKEFPVLERILKEFNIENPTMQVKDISNIHGKITVSSVDA